MYTLCRQVCTTYSTLALLYSTQVYYTLWHARLTLLTLWLLTLLNVKWVGHVVCVVGLGRTPTSTTSQGQPLSSCITHLPFFELTTILRRNFRRNFWFLHQNLGRWSETPNFDGTFSLKFRRENLKIWRKCLRQILRQIEKGKVSVGICWAAVVLYANRLHSFRPTKTLTRFSTQYRHNKYFPLLY